MTCNRAAGPARYVPWRSEPALIRHAVRRTSQAIDPTVASWMREAGPDTLTLSTTVPLQSNTGQPRSTGRAVDHDVGVLRVPSAGQRAAE